MNRGVTENGKRIFIRAEIIPNSGGWHFFMPARAWRCGAAHASVSDWPYRSKRH
jgi:hypothetical protein